MITKSWMDVTELSDEVRREVRLTNYGLQERGGGKIMSKRPNNITSALRNLYSSPSCTIIYDDLDLLEKYITQLEADSERLDTLENTAPSSLIDMIRMHCVEGGKTLREMVDWVWRNIRE